MEKVYLKYDDIRPCVECDFGFAKEILYMGFWYPLKKGNIPMFLTIFLFLLSVCALLIVFMPVFILYRFLLCIIMIIIINFLFASNYNMVVIEKLLKLGYYPLDYESSDKLIKKGIYFKLQ